MHLLCSMKSSLSVIFLDDIIDMKEKLGWGEDDKT